MTIYCVERLLPAIVVVAVIAVVLFFFWQYDGEIFGSVDTTPSPCRELSDEEIDGLVGAFLKKKGYEIYELVSVSPLYCENGKVGVRNMVAQTVLNEGLPTQYTKTIRLQMRTDATEMKIYEVSLTKPA